MVKKERKNTILESRPREANPLLQYSSIPKGCNGIVASKEFIVLIPR